MHTCAFSIIKLIPHMVDSPLFCDCVCAGMYVIQKYNNQLHPRGEEGLGKDIERKEKRNSTYLTSTLYTSIPL
jgi:hypothetical protein